MSNICPGLLWYFVSHHQERQMQQVIWRLPSAHINKGCTVSKSHKAFAIFCIDSMPCYHSNATCSMLVLLIYCHDDYSDKSSHTSKMLQQYSALLFIGLSCRGAQSLLAPPCSPPLLHCAASFVSDKFVRIHSQMSLSCHGKPDYSFSVSFSFPRPWLGNRI